MRLHVKVVPGASRDEISCWLGDRSKVRVRAPAEGGRANAALMKVLALGLGVSPQALAIVSGAASAHKVIEVDTLSEGEVRQRLSRSDT